MNLGILNLLFSYIFFKTSELYNEPLLAFLASLLIRNSPINTMPKIGCTAGTLQADLDHLTPGRLAVFENPNLKEARKKT